jgi:Y_Y_Y domain/Histidine kinase/Histidine kinase-, DNA gyrase B-, and HSP90-like ATPase
VNRRELNAYADGGKVLPNFITYGKSDGLPALECSGGSQPACWRAHDGHLWFTTVRGAVWVDPASARVNRLPPPVHIEVVRVDGESMSFSRTNDGPLQKIRVPAGQHYFEFQFCALSFTAPDRVKFQWRLAGLENDWVDGGDHHSASYSYIPPGSYRFEVKACNNDGVWNDTPATLELTVLPYFWQQWWFKISVALAFISILVVIYSVRVARLRALERLRLRIARDLHDEVGANLGSISLLAQMMEQTPSSADATQVRGIAVQTIDTLRDIIWFIDPKHDKLSDLVQRLEETARLMLATIKYRFEQSGDFNSADLSLAFRRNVPPLFKEALHNILKHSHATEVQIQVWRAGENFYFCIRDNGIGFDPARKNSGNGLRNLRKRAAEIGGSVEIQSTPGAGATINLQAPITQTRDWFKAGS